MLPIPGTSSRAHLEENLGAAIDLTAEDVDAIARLVPEGPTPPGRSSPFGPSLSVASVSP